MCLRKCKLCKSNVKTIVFEGFANWMQDDGNQQKYFKQYIKIFEKMMTNPCRIDARKSNAKNIENDAKMGVEIHQQNMKKYKNASRKMMQTNCSETCLENYEKTCLCDSVNYGKIM